jgi:hypothetical protein
MFREPDKTEIVIRGDNQFALRANPSPKAGEQRFNRDSVDPSCPNFKHDGGTR